MKQAGPISSFTTAGTAPPPPTSGATTIVLRMSNTSPADLHGNWSMLADPTASGGAALRNPDAGQAKIAPALSAPANYFERTFTAYRGVAYHLWVRLKAQNNALGNDSVHVQFTGSTDASGAATLRLGTPSSAEVVLQGGPSDPSIAGWGWADNGWGTPGASIYFDADGQHTVRVQQREDGAIVDEIVLSPDTYLSSPPGPRDNDTTTLEENDGSGPPPPPPPPSDATIVLWTAHAPPSAIVGTSWQMLTDSTAAGGAGLWNPDRAQAKIAPALAAPGSYVELTFNATGGIPYHLWLRMRAQNNALSNDSVHVQFLDSVNQSGQPVMQIGTPSSAEVILQNGATGSADQGWGWADNGWGVPGAPVYFPTTGSRTLRIQQREDGAIVDQIVLSPDTYISSPPGPRQNDGTILDENGSAPPPPPPPPPSDPTIVLWTAQAPASAIVGTSWQPLTDSTAAGGAAVWNPDLAQAKIAPALATPGSYVELAFSATGGIPYHLWLRMRAQNNAFSNDSVHVQFTDSVDQSGRAVMQIGTPGSAEVILQNGATGSADQQWGWADNGWGVPGAPVYFPTTGSRMLRIQQREDGPIVDQIVLSPNTYLTMPPGPRQNDGTILDPTQ
jgi:hypothetical protein